MKRVKKKFLSCCIALTLILGSVPATLLAEDSQSSLAYTVEREDDGEYIYHHFSLRGSLPAGKQKWLLCQLGRLFMMTRR